MAVYHALSHEELTRQARGVSLTLTGATPVAKGSINTNYSLECAEGRFFLRLTHVRGKADLDFEAGLLAHLKAARFPCPSPLLTPAGQPYQATDKGLVTVFHFLPGEELTRQEVTPEHSFRAGEEMGKLHRLSSSFSGARQNPYSFEIVKGWAEGLKSQRDAEVQAALPTIEKALARASQASDLALGPIHADYFRDNVKWIGDRISAVFDFEMACNAPFMLDVGIGLCEWAFDERFEAPKLRAYVEGYFAGAGKRAGQLDGLFEMTLFGAARYTCSRIRDFHLSTLGEGQLVKKDFRRYLRRAEELLQMEERGFQQACGIARE